MIISVQCEGEENYSYMTTEEPIGAEEAAKMLGVTSRTVIKLAERKEIPGFRVGKLWKFYSSDIRDYIDRQRRGTDKPDNR
jgi:excisionase family DNA binding protein